MNCTKGGIFRLQLCGWLGAEELWVGQVSDSYSMVNTDILKIQDLFVKADLVNGVNLPFTHILDKGYWVIQVAWREEKQKFIQPSSASSDRKFSADEMLVSATMATD
jgi:hypothetical protein